MTIRQFALKHLTDNGLFPSMAEAVIERYAASGIPTSDKRWWQDHTEGYPSHFLAVLVMGLNNEAVRWIDANIPQHWARPMFADYGKITEAEALRASALRARNANE